MSEFNNVTRQITATGVPLWAIKRVAEQMRADNIPVNPSTVVRYAVGRLAGIPRDEISDFTVPPRSRNSRDLMSELENVT